MKELTPDEIRYEIRQALIETAVAIAIEAALMRAANRLTRGRRKPGGRWLRRALGAVLSELAAEGIGMTYAQRRKARAAVDRAVAREEVARHQPGLVHVPAQRQIIEVEGRPQPARA